MLCAGGDGYQAAIPSRAGGDARHRRYPHGEGEPEHGVRGHPLSAVLRLHRDWAEQEGCGEQRGMPSVSGNFSTVLTPFLVLTITALYTSPFLTFAFGNASLMATLITSPTEANRLCEPPRTLIHITFLAPLLSADFKIVCI